MDMSSHNHAGHDMTMHSGMDMSSMTMDHNMSSSMKLMGMDMMAMVFFTSENTPLFSWAWTPSNTAAYVGTCFFLIILAAISRGLLVVRTKVWSVLAARKHSVKLDQENQTPDNTTRGRRSWGVGSALTIAAIDTVLTGVGYLLMLAAMTMNVGYFMSVLAGAFVGSMTFNQFAETTMGTSCG